MLNFTGEHEVDHDKDGPAEERENRFAESVSEELSGSVAGSVFHEGDAADHEKDRDGKVGQAFDEVGADPPGFGAVGPEDTIHVEVNDSECSDDAEVENVGFLVVLHGCVAPGMSVRQIAIHTHRSMTENHQYSVRVPETRKRAHSIEYAHNDLFDCIYSFNS